MYEELVQFLLGKKDEFTEEDLDEFIELLNKALDIVDEYDICKRESIIENMVDNTNIVDKKERETVSKAIDNILQLDGYSNEVNLLENDKQTVVPLRDIKFLRRRGGVKTNGHEERKTSKTRDEQKRKRRKAKNEEKKVERVGIVETKITAVSKENTSKKRQLNPVETTKKEIKESGEDKNTSSQFKFDIGSLEDNKNEGPEYKFKIDE